MDDANASFLRLRAAHASGAAVGRDDVQPQLAAADHALAKLVRCFAADGLDGRDAAEPLATQSARIVLVEVAMAAGFAVGVGWLVGRSLGRPLESLVQVITALAAGQLEREVAPKRLHRHDEIGALGRAVSVFRSAMQQNVQLEAAQHENQRRCRKVRTQRRADGGTGRGTDRFCGPGVAEHRRTHPGEQRSPCTEPGGRRAGELLSASSQEIAEQVGTAAALASMSRIGERARLIMDQLSRAVSQIGAMAGLIGDIANKTNLLALNATIEAAHACTAGRERLRAPEARTRPGQVRRSPAGIRAPAEGVCLDLSLGGALMRLDETLAQGSAATLRLAGLPDLPCEIIDAGSTVRLRLTWDAADAPPELHDRLRTLAAA